MKLKSFIFLIFCENTADYRGLQETTGDYIVIAGDYYRLCNRGTAMGLS